MEEKLQMNTVVTEKHPWKIDVAVLLIFFVRSETFEKVFQSVREAHPRTLLLWQDGPRENRPKDIEGIVRCRNIAEQIDWDCEIHKHYCEKNYGCDPSTFYADKWAFSLVDKCIILEDDQVPSQSFYLYCKELLDKYEFDERISHICGHNFGGEYKDYLYDYLFSFTGTGAWASWRRVAKTWDETYASINDTATLRNVRGFYGKRAEKWISYAKRHKKSGIAHWESIIGMSAHMNSRLVIIPRINLVLNIGIGENATHSVVSDPLLIPQRVKRVYIPGEELDFPIRHPRYVVPEMNYITQSEKAAATSPWLRFRDRIEISVNILRHYGFRELLTMVRKRLKKF